MSRIGLRAVVTFEGTTGLLLIPAISSITAVQTTFEHASGSVGTRAGLRKYFPFAHEYLRARLVTNNPTTLHTLLQKLRRLGPVWSIPSHGAPDTALVNINSDKETTTELDNHLLDTSYLRTTPLVSLLLAGVAQTDLATYKKYLYLSDHITHQHVPAIVSLVAQEIRAAAVPTASISPSHLQPIPNTFQPAVSIARRRGVANLLLHGFSSLLSKFRENDYSMLAQKILEDPDFPVAPFWHEDYTAQRLWLDTAIRFPEDSGSGFFVHEVLLKKVLRQLNSAGVFPHAGKLRLLRSSAATETQKFIKAEAEASTTNELNRLLRYNIEHLIPLVAYTEEQHRALRLVALDRFHAADVMKLLDSSIISLMMAEMHQIMNDEDGISDLDKDRICDIISEYRDDVDEHYWNDKSVLDIICNDQKRDLIEKWILAADVSYIVHRKLFVDKDNYAPPLEPIERTIDQVSGLKSPKTPISNMH